MVNGGPFPFVRHRNIIALSSSIRPALLLFAVLIVEHKLALIVIEELGGPLHVDKEAIRSLYISELDAIRLPPPRDAVRRLNEMKAVSQRRFEPNFREKPLCILLDLHVLFVAANRDNFKNLLLRIRLRLNDQQSVQQIDGDPMGRQLRSPSNLGDPAVRRHDQDRRQITLHRPIQKGKALDIEHMNLRRDRQPNHTVNTHERVAIKMGNEAKAFSLRLTQSLFFSESIIS